MDCSSALQNNEADARLNRILHRRRRLLWSPETESVASPRSILSRSGIVLVEEVIPAQVCQRIKHQLPKLRPVAPTRIIEPSHRMDLLVYAGGYVSQVLRESWALLAPFMEEELGPNPEVVELSAMVSFPGAARQAPHPDVKQGTDQASMYSVFIPLTDQSFEMGPLLAWPGTHLEKPAELPMQDVVPMLTKAGSLIIMDSRLYHCGGANCSQVERPVLYFTLKGPGPTPQGSTLSLLPELRGASIAGLV